MLCADQLLTLEPFQQLPKKQLQWACDRAQSLTPPAGTVLIQEGGDPNGFFILLKGRVSITHLSEGVDMPIGQHEAPSFFGEIPVLTDGPVEVTMRTLTVCEIYQINCADFLTLLHDCRGFERSIFRAVSQRLRGLESFIRSREKMAALGTLSAGLAHELNNPAAALVRAMRDVVPAMQELERMNFNYGQQNPDPKNTEDWQRTRDRGYDTILNRSSDSKASDAMAMSDREDELLDWLEGFSIEDAWKLAEPLATAGVEIDTLERLTTPWRDSPTELRTMGIRWLALSFDVMTMIKNGLRGAERISGLVHSMKSYSHMDQGAQQFVDVHIDAMDEKGTLEIRTGLDGHYARVEIVDSGPGISQEIQTRIFEPFFTTKAMGKGTGLGVDAVQRIIKNRHQGSVTVESQPGRTCFMVYLPLSKDSLACSSS